MPAGGGCWSAPSWYERTMTEPKTPEASTTDADLTDADLEQVTGGVDIVQDVTVHKQKTADKAYEAMNKYIKG